LLNEDLLVLFPTRKALLGISSLQEYLEFAASHQATCIALEAYKNNQLNSDQRFLQNFASGQEEESFQSITVGQYIKINSPETQPKLRNSYLQFLQSKAKETN